MDYFQMGIISSQIVLLIIFLIWGKYWRQKTKYLGEEKRQQDHSFERHVEDMTLDIFDKIEELEYEVNDIHKLMITFQQQQISWRTLKKEQPEVFKRVLLLHSKNKTEHTGYLNADKLGWTAHTPGGQSYEVHIDEFSHWKELVGK